MAFEGPRYKLNGKISDVSAGEEAIRKLLKPEKVKATIQLNNS